MSRITIDNLDDETLAKLKAEADRRKVEVGVAAGHLLTERLTSSMTVESSDESPHKRRDLSDLAGTWTDEEADTFLASISVFESVDEDLWK